MKAAYGISPSIFGDMLVAFSSNGVCALYPHYQPGSVHHHSMNQAYIERIWQEHQLVKGGKSEDRAATEIVRAFVNKSAPEGKSCAFDIIYGSDFQKAIWQELLKIPYGETRSYSELAGAVDNPKAHRAVGTACGANPLTILIPCHRAVGASHPNLYRWGAEMKTALLEREKNGS